MGDFEFDYPLNDLEIRQSVKDSVILANHIFGSHQPKNSWIRKEVLQLGGTYATISRLRTGSDEEMHFVIGSSLFVPEDEPPNNYDLHFNDPTSEPTIIYKGKITELTAETDDWRFKASHYAGSLLVNTLIGIQYLKEKTLDSKVVFPSLTDQLVLGELRTMFLE